MSEAIDIIRKRIEGPLQQIQQQTMKESRGGIKGIKAIAIAQIRAETEVPVKDYSKYIWLSKYKMRKKRMRAKFKANPHKYLPLWFFAARAGELASRYIRARMSEDGFGRRIYQVEEI